MYRHHYFRTTFPVLAFLSAIVISACARTIGQPDGVTGDSSPEKVILTSELKDQGPAPELTNDVWLNTDSPLRIGDLKDKVVLLDFWTFG